MPALFDYNACMKGIQYTVRGVKPRLDRELRREARASGKTLNAVVVETLEHSKLPADAIYDDLDWFIGSEAEDTAAAKAQQWLDSLPADIQ